MLCNGSVVVLEALWKLRWVRYRSVLREAPQTKATEPKEEGAAPYDACLKLSPTQAQCTQLRLICSPSRSQVPVGA